MPPNRMVAARWGLRLELRVQARASGWGLGETREGRTPRGQSQRAWAGLSVRQRGRARKE